MSFVQVSVIILIGLGVMEYGNADFITEKDFLDKGALRICGPDYSNQFSTICNSFGQSNTGYCDTVNIAFYDKSAAHEVLLCQDSTTNQVVGCAYADGQSGTAYRTMEYRDAQFIGAPYCICE